MKVKFIILLILIFALSTTVTYAAENQTITNETQKTSNQIETIPSNTNYENNTQYSIYYMDIPNKDNNIRLDKPTYFSNILTNIKQHNYFQVILKTPHFNSVGDLEDFEGIPLTNKNVTFYINNVPYTKTTDSNGIAQLQINLSPGTYTIKYAFNGDSQYSKYSSEININVFSGNTYLLPLEKDLYRTETFKVALFDENETPLSNKNILISVDGGNSYSKTTDSNGIAELKINLNPSQYLITYNFLGNGSYQSCSGFCQITVSMKNIVMCPIDLNIKKGTSFRTKVTDSLGNPVRNQTIKYTVNGNPYYKITDSEGIARLTINLNEGTYIINTEYESTGYTMYYAHSNSYSMKVFENNSNQYKLISLGNCIQQGTPYQIRLTDLNNNPLSNKNIYLTINGVCYTKTSDSNGIVKLTLNLGCNNYIICTSYGDSSSLISNYEMITVTDNKMNNNSNITDNDRLLYITTNSSYQCLNNSYIINLANNITNGITNELEKAVLIHNYVCRLDYKYNSNGLNNALKVALLNQGNCYDQTNLLMALAKASGIPVRGVLGNPTIMSSGHTWAQFFIGNKWIVSDPTNTNVLGSWSINYNGEYFTNYTYCKALAGEIYIIL